jgi:hypothetical protein
METLEMQLPFYVKIIGVAGAMLVIFVLAAWELVNEWIASAAKAFVRAFKPRVTPKKPILPKSV